MSKKYTLNKTWKLCLEMWTWIVKEWKRTGKNVSSLKEQWLKEHGFGEISLNCFFCEYRVIHKREAPNSICLGCPASFVDPKFSCINALYDYEDHPDKFLNKIRALNRKRLKAKAVKK